MRAPFLQVRSNLCGTAEKHLRVHLSQRIINDLSYRGCIEIFLIQKCNRLGNILTSLQTDFDRRYIFSGDRERYLFSGVG